MSNEISRLPAKPGQMKINGKRGRLKLEIEKQTEIQGIGMGVLKDGTRFLNQRGLARLCGVENAHIGTISSQWNEADQKPRIKAIKELLNSRGVSIEVPHLVLMVDGKPMFAYPDKVCLAILEYYAFEAGNNSKEEARKNFRILAGSALQDFIYPQVGYSPVTQIPIAWQQFHDHVSLVYDSVLLGYFSVFKEIVDVVVTLIRGGAAVGSEFPDVSVGQHWAKHWKDSDLAQIHSERIQYAHNYPEYFPQATSNRQSPYCYPDSCLGEFRRWMRATSLSGKFPSYLAIEVNQGALAPSFAQIAIGALSARMLPEPQK
jgi:hypothetical protein